MARIKEISQYKSQVYEKADDLNDEPPDPSPVPPPIQMQPSSVPFSPTLPIAEVNRSKSNEPYHRDIN